MLSAVPVFHSLPSSLNKIYLDFDGQVVTDSYWTVNRPPGELPAGNNGQPIHAPIYNIPGDADYEFDAALGEYVPLPFSQAELAYLEMAFQLIAEDFAPFDVDVTTVEPPPDYFTGSSLDGGRAIRVLFTSRIDDARLGGTGNNWIGNDNVSGIGAFDAWTSNVDRPVWVFTNQFDTVMWDNHPSTGGTWGPLQEYAGFMASHELGHGFGLHHDGDFNGTTARDQEYYVGHGGFGATSWGPIMGGGVLRHLTQSSSGEYTGATNA